MNPRRSEMFYYAHPADDRKPKALAALPVLSLAWVSGKVVSPITFGPTHDLR
jgi:hypothetical protein